MTFDSRTVPPPSLDPGAGRWYHVRRGEVLVVGDDGLPPEAQGAATDTEAIFLGLDDGVGCWAVGVDATSPAPDAAAWVPLLDLGSLLSPQGWTIAGRAVQLVEWLRTSRWCGRCATPTRLDAIERAVRCPTCGLNVYPRLAPAVIVLVHRDDEMLLARNGRFRGSMFSTVAGFVEPGETLEETVHREVAEEVGVRLRDLRYVASQPWPFPHSLMVGFWAEWAGGEIEVDGDEIVEAGWFRPGSLPQLPPPLSIARRLIDGWMDQLPTRGGGT